MLDRICLWSHLVLGFCLLENVYLGFNFITYNWSVYIHYFFLVQSSKVVPFLIRICPFLPSCPFIDMYLLVVDSYDPLYRCGVGCNFSFFISPFIILSAIPFSWWVWLKVCQFCYVLKEPAFSFIDFLLCFKNSISL